MIKLAGRGGAFDLEANSASPPSASRRSTAVTRLAIAAGLDALRDAGIPLAMRYKNTSKGTRLPDRWGLPDDLRDSTGVIFASVFPGYDSFADEAERYYADRARREQLAMLEDLRERSGSRLRRWPPKSTAASPSCARRSPEHRTSSTGASCSASSPWGIRSSPN